MNMTMPWKASADTSVNGVTTKLDEVRRALGQEAERLAQLAAQYSRETGEHASNLADEAGQQAVKAAHEAGSKAASVAHDPVGSASTLAQQVVRGAAAIGTAIAASSRKTARDIGHDAQSVAEDLRRVRITTEPKKTGPDFMPGITLLGGFGAGIALMYFFDPEQGKRRRNMLRDRLLSFTRRTARIARGRANDLSNRAAGAVHETRKAVQNATARADDFDADADTQTWVTAHANGSQPANGTTDGSTTDTWGELPQDQQRIEVG